MLTRISVGFNNPIGIDHHEPSNQVVLSVHYSGGRPYNFELVAPDGTRSKFSDIHGLTEEVKIACVRSGPNQGGFVVGELFTGTGVPGAIARISPDGSSIQNPWVRLPGERGLMRGSLFQDRYGVFGGDLIAVTTAGGVWRITSEGVATRLAQLNTHLEGVTTVPDDPAKYGPWAGRILAGAEDQGRIYAISETGSVGSYSIGVSPEDIEIIPEDQNFYGVDYGGRTLWGAPASAFADMVGDFLIAQEFPGILWHVWWDAAAGKFQRKSLAQVSQWEHVAFSPAGLLTIPPVPDTRDPCPPAPPQPGPAPTSVTFLGPAAVLCERPLRVSAQLTNSAGNPIAARTLVFSAAGLSASAATDSAGIARAVLEPGHVASPISLLVTFAGAPDLLPSSAQATLEIQPAESALAYTGRTLLALGIAQEVSARLTDALDGRPLQGRAVAFQVGSQAARATTDANGLATTAVTVPVGERPAEVAISFAGDPCYRPSSARAPIVAYLPTSFVVWGGNPPGPTRLSIGQRVNFWGAQWAKQVAGGDYDAHADFKGYATLAGGLRICQPAARTTGSPRLDPSCWTSKPGQSGPPAPPLPEHIGVIVATSIAKDQSTIYGNVAAVVVVRVDPNPAYGAVPGKPGFGTIVGAVEDGAGLFPQPPALLASQTQPVTAIPGEAFDVTASVSNPSSATAAGVTLEQRFEGVTPASARIEAGAIEAGASRSFVTRVTAMPVGAREDGESSAAYAARLESADGRDLRSSSTVSFHDAAGQAYPSLLAASASRLRLPRLAATLTGTTCLGPGSAVAYEVGAANVGSADAASATARLRFPDGTSSDAELGGLAVGGVAKAPFQWKVPALPPKGAAESPQEYEARLLAQDAQPLTAVAALTWKDALGIGGGYGAIEQPFANTLRVPVVATVPKEPAPLLPGARTALVYSTQNRGSGNAFKVQIRVTSPGGAVASCSPFALRGSSEPTPVQVAGSVPALPDRKPGESAADYLARLRAADGAPLEFRHVLTWEDASENVYGPVEGSIAGAQVLPVLSLSLQGPETAMSGDAIGYAATVTNEGRADAGSVIVHFVLPDGSTRDVQLPTLPAGATGRAPATFMIPAAQATGTIVATASLTWRDAVPNAYGPIEATAATQVTHRNQAPEVNAGADQTLVLPAGASLKGAVKDDAYPVGAPLTVAWSKVSGPGQVTFADPGQAVTTASFSAPGTYVLRLTASDSELTGRDDVTIQVKPALQVNQPPLVKAGADRTVTLPEPLVLEGQVTDDGLPMGGTLQSVWTQVSGPGLITFADPHAPATTATFSQPGAYLLRLTASDSELVASDDVAVTVNPAVPLNQPPAVEAGPDETTSVAVTIELRGDVTDDGRPVGADLIVQWSVVSGPGAAVFGSPNHAITTVTLAEAGTYVLRLSASDSQYTASDDVTITVTPAVQINHPPVVDAGEARTIQLPAGVDLAAMVIDDGFPVGGVLRVAWSQVSGPGEATFVDPETAATTARFSLPGTYVLRFTADDSEFQTSDDVTITVEPAPILNDAPVVNAGPNQAITLPAALTLNGSVTDDGQPEGGVLAIEWSQVSGPGPVTFADRTNAATTATFVDPGTYVLRLTADDSQLTSSSDLTVTASAPAGVKPTVSLTSPADGAEVTTFTDVIGSVSGGIWKLEYRLDGDGASTAPWTVFASGGGAVANAKLGVFDPTMLLNGTYAIRLTATTASGSASATRSVVVTGELKLGNFTLSFLDLEVPMAGIPIQILRSYDSRDKRKGDFGIGWTLGIKDVRLEKSAVLGMHWQQTVSGLTIPSYCLQASRPLTVTITFPSGKIYKFQATTTPKCQSLYPVEEAKLGFVPMSGTQGSLVALEQTGGLVLSDGSIPGPVELVASNTLQTLNPALFRLTAEDGTEYVIHQKTGLQSIKDLNGNTVTFTANGIIHSRGASVTFVRDGQGRITKIVDPAGNAMTYFYDARGDLVIFTDAVGNVSRYGYNDRHGLLRIDAPNGARPVRNEYDEAGRLIATTDASGARITFDRDLANRREVVTDRLGNVTVHAYDARGYLVEKTDALGNTTTYAHDAAGNKLRETDPLGRTTSYTYNAVNKVTAETDPLGKVTKGTYNARGQLLTRTDRLGRVQTIAYDAKGNPVNETDALGKVTMRTFDASGNLLTVTDPLGNVTTATYDGRGNPTKIVDPVGEVIRTYDAHNNPLTITRTVVVNGVAEATTQRLAYDTLNRLIELVDGEGGSRKFTYTASGKRASETDALGNVTSFAYDLMDRLVSTRFPDGTTETSVYDAEGHEIDKIDRAGRTTQFAYDKLGRKIKTTFPDGATILATYDAAGQKITETDENGGTTVFSYDAAGRNTSIQDPLGGITRFDCDAVGSRIAQTDRNGRTTTFEYDAADRLIRKVYPDGTFTLLARDANGQVIAETDQAGHTTTFQYDTLGNLLQVTDVLGNTTRYLYGRSGNRIRHTDPLGNVTSFDHDRAGRQISKTLPLGQRETRVYDAAGNLRSIQDFNGQSTLLSHDVCGRLVETRLPEGEVIARTYTLTGKLESLTDGHGATRFTYDLRDRPTRVELPDGGELHYAYDAKGNRTEVTTPAGTTRYTYDLAGRMTALVDPKERTTTFGYDAAGNRKSIALPNGVTITYSYDTLNRLVGIQQRKGADVLRSYAYVLGPAGNRTQVAESGGRAIDYGYDALFRLTREAITAPAGGLLEFAYTYDAAGNRTSRTGPEGTALSIYDANDRLLRAGEVTFTYDSNGSLLTRSDALGTSRYEYDGAKRLVGFTAPGGAVTRYVYDGLDHRVQKHDASGTTRYLVDPFGDDDLAQVLREIDPSGAAVDYVYHHHLISEERTSGISFLLHDGQMSTRDLANASGALTDHYDYDAFGNLVASNGTTPNLYLYNGQQLDPNIGFYYLRARYYDPSIGRFVTTDPVAGNVFDPPSLHPYVYAHSNPINRSDPSGQSSMAEVAIVSAIIGALAGITTYIATGSKERALYAMLYWTAVSLVIGTFIYSVGLVLEAGAGAGGVGGIGGGGGGGAAGAAGAGGAGAGAAGLAGNGAGYGYAYAAKVIEYIAQLSRTMNPVQVTWFRDWLINQSASPAGRALLYKVVILANTVLIRLGPTGGLTQQQTDSLIAVKELIQILLGPGPVPSP